MPDTIAGIFGLSSVIRYVALYRGGRLTTASRPDLAEPSGAESDQYEETIVNPTLVTLLTQRGNIDCGGLEYVLIRYGSFFALVMPLPDGHATIGIEASVEPLALVPRLHALLPGR